MRPAEPRTLVIAIGNDFRCDDAAALVAARRLREQASHVCVIEHTGDGAALLDLWQDADAVILLDAVQSGAPPGTIHRFTVDQNLRLPASFPSCTHRFGIVQALDLAIALRRLPRTLMIYGIEGECFEHGVGLSVPVQSAVERLITELLRSRLGSSNRDFRVLAGQ